MQWRIKKLNYDILIPKSYGKHIYQFDEQEAASYFEWYMEKVPERVAYVSKVCAKELHISEEKMDLSPESLLLLWKWFRQRAQKEKIPKSERTNSIPASHWANKHQLTLETEYIIRDIGMYVGETFRKNNPQIYWTYYTKPHNDFFVNYPLLKGFVDKISNQTFCPVFEPIHMTRMQALNILDNTSKDTDLFKIYNIWSKKTGDGLREP